MAGPVTPPGNPPGPETAGTKPAPAPVSTWPMWALGLVLLVDSTDQSIVRGLITPLKQAFHIGDAAIGVLTSAFILVNGLVTVPAGYLADRWHRTRTIGHTIVAWSGLTALGAAAPNFPSLVALRGALGFGQAITEPSAASLLSDYYPTEQRGRAFAIQQIMMIAGFGLGVGLGGAVGATLGWRWAFLLVGGPSTLVALLAYRLKEPKRGAGDRMHVGIVDDPDLGEEPVHQPLFTEGFGTFLREMAQGLRADLRTIWSITTMRFALIGVSALLFTITAVGTWLPQFYERQLHVANGRAEGYVAVMVILGGVPGILLGGRFADRYAARVRGARVAIPAYCIIVGATCFAISWMRLPFAPAFVLEILGFFVITMAIPGLRAGLSDAVPANLRGAGFGAFNLVSVVFGGALAPLIVSVLSQSFGNNLRTAFLIIIPPVYLGAYILLRAREHLEADAAKIFQAVLSAMQEQQARDQQAGAVGAQDDASHQ